MILKYLIYLVLISIIGGSVISFWIVFLKVDIYLTDIIAGLITLVWISKITTYFRIIKKDKISKCFLLFSLISLGSLFLTPINLNLNEKLISSLYLLRLLFYFNIYISILWLQEKKIITHREILKKLSIIGLLLSIIGWMQYFIYPDLRNLYYLGWDPHYKRIFSSFLDPNYFGIVQILNLILIFFLYGYKKIWSIFALIFTFLTILFTYSRGSFLALFAGFAYFCLKRSRIKFILLFLLIFIPSLFLLPRPFGIGVRLERVFSIQERILNYKQAWTIIRKNPFLGVGFNTLRYAKKQYGFLQEDWQTNHSGAGFDSSLLFIAATTGIIGLILYLFFLYRIFKDENLFTRVSLLTILVHSFTVNSLFYPWVMVWMWVILAARDYRSLFVPD